MADYVYDPMVGDWNHPNGDPVYDSDPQKPPRLTSWLSIHTRLDLWLGLKGVSDGAYRLLFGCLFYALNDTREDVVPHSALDQIMPTWRMSHVQELRNLGLLEVEQPGGVGSIQYRLVRPFSESWRFRRPTPNRPPIPAALREAVYDRDGRQCLHCGSPDKLSLDHIHPFSKGGEDTFENLQTLCRPCNSRKGARVS